MQKQMSLKEYYSDVIHSINELKVAKKDVEKNIKLLEKSCDTKDDNATKIIKGNFEKTNKILKNNRQTFIEILKVAFKTQYFENVDINKINSIFIYLYNLKDDNIKEPKSFDELVNMINKCFNNYYSLCVPIQTKMLYGKALSLFMDFLADVCVDNINLLNCITLTLDSYNRFIYSYNNKTKIDIDSINKTVIEVMNASKAKYIALDENKRQFEMGLGDTFLYFCEAHNKDLDFVNDEVNNLKLHLKADKYCKKIKSIPFDKLDTKNFPKYTNKNFIDIMNIILKNLESDLSDNEELLPYYTVLMMHYANYIKNSYSDKDVLKDIKVI